MNANLKIFVTGFIIIVVAYFLIVKRKRRTSKTFKTKTMSEKNVFLEECRPVYVIMGILEVVKIRKRY